MANTDVNEVLQQILKDNPNIMDESDLVDSLRKVPAQSKSSEIEVSESEYKGHPLVVLKEGRLKFQFGKAKARMILEEAKLIQDFVNDGEVPEENLWQTDSGNDNLCLNPEAQYRFSFGKPKATLALACLNEIEDWLDTQDD